MKRSLLSSLSPYNAVLRLRPVRAFLFSWIIGLILAAASLWLGAGLFHAGVVVLDGSKNHELPLSLGYIEQLNYGVWFLIPFLCPTVFALCVIIFRSSQSAPPEWRRYCNLSELTDTRLIAGVGIVICTFFLCKDVLIEVRDYKTLGLGWVQAESIEDQWKQNVKYHLPSTPIRRRFRTFDINEKQVQAAEVDLVSVSPPDFHIRSHRAFLVFVLAAKLWCGFWEGLVVYMSVLLAIWSVGVYRAVDPSADAGLYKPGDKTPALIRMRIEWAQPVVICTLLLGLEINFFSILRFVANAAKGSFGSRDQYWSMLTLSPAVIVAFCAISILVKAVMSKFQDLGSFASRMELALWAVWGLSYVMLVHLIIGFNDAPTDSLLSSAVKHCAQL